MKQKDIFIFIILIPLGLSFLVITTLLFFNNGKSRKLIAAKLKLGALILSFSWFTTSCDIGQTCYAPAPAENSVYLYNNDTLNISLNDSLKLIVNNPTFNNYSYRINDTLNSLKQNGLCEQLTDSLRYNSKVLYFLVDKSLGAGKYNLEVFGEKSTDLKYVTKLQSFPLYIK